MRHPDYDQFWKKEAWVNQLHSSTVPNLNVAGFWDQEDPWGPWQIFRHAQQHDPENTNFMVAGPWFHGGWAAPVGDSIGPVSFGGHKTAVEFRQNIQAPFFRHYLHGEGGKPAWQVTTFQAGSNTWHTYTDGPRSKRSRPTFTSMQTGLFPSMRRQAMDPSIANTSPIPRIRYLIVLGPSPPLTHCRSGDSGKWPTSVSWIIVRTC